MKLRVFFMVAREKSFTRGAQFLNITQPAASLRIRELERDCGNQLFYRIGKEIVLTDAGQTLFGYAQRIFSLVSDADHALQNARDLKSGHLRIAASHTVATLIAPLLIKFKVKYPGLQVTVLLGNSEKILSDIRELRADVGILAKPTFIADLLFLPFSHEVLGLIVPKKHPLAGKRSVSLKALDGEGLLFREPGSGTRAIIERAFNGAGVSQRLVMELTTNEAIKMAVEANLGLAILPLPALKKELSGGKLSAVRILDNSLTVDLNWTYLKDRKESRVLQALTELVQNEK